VNALRDEAIVLRTYKLGEADLICVLFTRDNGKVRAVAHGVRRTTSKLGARMEALDHVDVQLASSRTELRSVRQVQPCGPARSVRDDYTRLTSAMVLVEAADAATLEGHADPELFEMLRRALLTLETAVDPTVVATAFLFKVLVHDGAAPVIDQCATCGEDDELVAFDFTEGGLLCPKCRRGRPVSADAVELLRRMLLGGLASVLAEPSPKGGHEVGALAIEAMEAHVGRRLRAAHANDAH
jgi:DNA repair protein RecO (recombination protein O)